MSRTRITTVDALAGYLESRPARLGCWRDGRDGRYSMLRWLNVYPVVQLGALAAEMGPEAATMLLGSQHHNQVGIGAGWVDRFMIGPRRARGSSEEDRVGMFKAAGDYWVLLNAMVEIREDVRRFELDGLLVRLPYQGNRKIDALDRLLDVAEKVESLAQRPPFADPRVRPWLASEGLKRPWTECPNWIKGAFREFAGHLLDVYPRYLPDGARIAGFTIAELRVLWLELLAWGMYMHSAIVAGSRDPSVMLPRLRRARFVDTLVEETGLAPNVVETLVTLLTLDTARCKDGALTPLFPLDEEIIPVSSLIVPTSPERNFLAIVQTDPSMVGEAGRLLGLAGEQAMSVLLERLRPDVLLGRRVKVLRHDGSTAGDLDIVACEPRTGSAVILEVKWGLAADGNAEAYRVERAALEKRAQVIRLRHQIDSGEATPRWASNWPDLTRYDIRWYVITHDVLVTRQIDDDDITIRSYQLLNRTLPPDSGIEQLIAALDSPPMPPEDLCRTEWDRIRYGDVRVEIESILA